MTAADRYLGHPTIGPIPPGKFTSGGAAVGNLYWAQPLLDLIARDLHAAMGTSVLALGPLPLPGCSAPTIVKLLTMEEALAMAIRRLVAVVAGLALVTAGCSDAPPGSSSSPATGAPSSQASPSSSPAPIPTGGTWQMLAAAPVTSGSHYLAKWTGSELLIYQPERTFGKTEVGSVGAAYDPARRVWRTLPSSPYPVMSTEAGSQIVWDGTELLVFGVQNAAYNPVTNKWRSVKGPPLPAPSVVTWTGDRVLIWGGGCCDDASNAGAAYDPETDSWQRLSTAPLAGRRAQGVWTGTELVVAGGEAHGETFFTDAAAYSPMTNTWRRLRPLPAPRILASMTWTGTEVLLVGGLSDYGAVPYADAVAYSPSTDSWRTLPAMPSGRYQHAAVWTGHHLIVWGGRTRSRAGVDPTTPPNGVVYDPATDHWYAMPKAPLKGRSGAAAVWTGTAMLIWGGAGNAYPYPAFTDGALYLP